MTNTTQEVIKVLTGSERAEAARIAKPEAVIAQICELITEYGISEDKIYGRKRAKNTANSAAALVAQPKTPKIGQTWCGRSRAPLWIRDAKNRDRFLIAE
ncbi:H-NS histone family protein [Burkholderia vietnamiensis]|uniref:H-NS histone family protein n=1 Tax=Burkholderia vietnamiensis TaxID=60552 RepID=UPI001B993FFC|nr:H-NS histone family protein [Burkholderia vietnamiensis]MBR7972391.1 H-NS histone family protein [Burkholderia vietnamiensis]